MARNIETFNFPTVMVSEFLQILEMEMNKDVAEIKKGNQDRIPYPMLAIGKAGIGKTEGIRGIARSNHWGFKEIRLCNYSETDLVGLPMIDKQKITNPDGTVSEVVRTKHAANDLFPDPARDGEFGILLVDEFTSALTNVQVPILQLTDSSRSVGDYSLPRGWKIVLAGNGPDDGGTFEFLPGTVISRASCFYVQADADGWLDWAKNSGHIHPTILAYIGNHKGDADNSVLHGYEPSSSGMDQAFPCPRSWAHLSAILKDQDDRYASLHPGAKTTWYTDKKYLSDNMAMFQNIVASVIGNKASIGFLTFISVADQMQNPYEVLNAATPEEKSKLKRVLDWESAHFKPSFTGNGGASSVDAIGVAYLSFESLADVLRNEHAAERNKAGNLAGYLPSDTLCTHYGRALAWILGITDPKTATFDKRVAHKEFIISGMTTIMQMGAKFGDYSSILDNPAFRAECPFETEYMVEMTNTFCG